MIPGGTTATIGSLIPKVQADLQNRADVTESTSIQPNAEMRPSAWLRDTIREITASWPFEELRVKGPQVTLVPGQYNYPIASFLNPGDDYTLMEDPVIFLTVPSPGVSAVAYPMDYMTPKAIAPLLNIQGGIPFKYTRYGGEFWFGTNPGQAYVVYLPYQLRHPFNAANLTESPVMMPEDWFDIVCYGAAERGAIALRWNDQATYLHNILYGDPDAQMSDSKKGRPGLLAARIMQIERDAAHSTRQFQPVVARY